MELWWNWPNCWKMPDIKIIVTCSANTLAHSYEWTKKRIHQNSISPSNISCVFLNQDVIKHGRIWLSCSAMLLTASHKFSESCRSKSKRLQCLFETKFWILKCAVYIIAKAWGNMMYTTSTNWGKKSCLCTLKICVKKTKVLVMTKQILKSPADGYLAWHLMENANYSNEWKVYWKVCRTCSHNHMMSLLSIVFMLIFLCCLSVW